ncbi:MAG: TetR/AcrR family transcriptional regulator [Acidimicrobiia bacterium]|nr:TetR/AcrR family transcriptional regulator [Acidimicrobiia bacterium]
MSTEDREELLADDRAALLADDRAELRAVDGRVPGRRGLATRRRLLDTTLALLNTSTYRDLKVVDITRTAGTSPATFYQYFPDVEAAVLVLAAELTEHGSGELRSLIVAQNWDDDPMAVARRVADGYLDFWQAHWSLIRVIDLAALEGDERFRDLRTGLLHGANQAMDALVDTHVAEGRLPETARPAAVAGVLTSMLAHVAAHRQGFENWGVPREQLRDTMAAIVAWSLSAAG